MAAESSSSGIYTGKGTTKTKPSKTICVLRIPPGITPEEIEKAFSSEYGFISFRTRSGMCFIDFNGVKESTYALRKYHGRPLPGASVETALELDFDKGDGARKRDRNFEMQREKQLIAQQLVGTISYGCSACGTEVLWLDPDGSIEEAPSRASEAVKCIDEAAFLRGIHICRDSPIDVTLAPDKTERRYPLNCPECDTTLAYRAGSLGEPAPGGQIYIYPEHIVLRRHRVEVDDIAFGDSTFFE